MKYLKSCLAVLLVAVSLLLPAKAQAVGNLTAVSSTLSSSSLGASGVDATFSLTLGSSLPVGGYIEVQLPGSLYSYQANSVTLTLVSTNPSVGSLVFVSKGTNPDTNSFVSQSIYLKTSGAVVPAGTALIFKIGGLTNGNTAQTATANLQTTATYHGTVLDGDSSNSSGNYYFQHLMSVGTVAFQGTVTNPSSNPVNQAWVNIFPASVSGGGAMPQGSLTDSAGKYLIVTTNVNVGTSYSLQVFAPFNGGGNLVTPDTYTALYNNSPITKNFQFTTATKTITGTVSYNGTAIGVTGAQVSAFKMNGSGFAQTTTDSSGHFTFTVGGGDWGVSPQAGNNSDWSYGQPPVTVKFATDNSTESQTADFTVYKASAHVTGRLLKPNGSPVTSLDGLGIGVFSQEGKGGGGQINNDLGTFSVAVPPGTYMINVWAPPISTYGTPSVDPVTVVDGQTKDVGDITLINKDSTITGSVKNSQGVGVSGVNINAFVRDGGGFSQATTDNSGNFTLSVTAGHWTVQPFLNMSSSYALDTPPQDVTVTSSASATVNFTVKSASVTISGVVQDTNGNPLSIYGYAFAENPNGGMMGPGGLGGPIERGSFSFKVPAGTYTINAGIAPGSGYTPSSGTTVTVNDGDTKNVVVTLASNDSTITGSIVNSQGTAISGTGIQVFAVSHGGGHEAFQQGIVSGSTYTISVAAGDWSLGFFVDPSSGYMSSPPGSADKFTITSGETFTKNISLLSANSTITGKITKPDGSAAAGVFVSVDNRETQNKDYFNGAPTDSNGNYTVKITAGTYKVRVNVAPGQGYLSPAEQNITVADSQTQTANFSLRQSDATISGTVTLNGSGTPAYVYAWSDDGGFAQSNAISDGTYSLSVSQGTTWHVGARYENGTNPYQSNETIISLNSATATADLTLSAPSYSLPQALTTTFDATKPKIINLTDGAEINIPANALASSGSVTLTISPKASLPVKKGDKPVWYGYQFTATDSNGQSITSFNSAITITFPYTDAQLTAQGITADDLIPSYFDDTSGTWKKVSNVTVDTTNKTVTISTDHFTDYALTANITNSGNSQNSSPSVSTTSSTPGCGDLSPASAPQIFQINRTRTSAKIYFVPAMNPVTYYYLSYGLKPGDDRYGVSFNQGASSGALTFTVDHLSPRATYYFRIRAGNGCTPGPWSDWFPKGKYKVTYSTTSTASTPTTLKRTASKVAAPALDTQPEPTTAPAAPQPQTAAPPVVTTPAKPTPAPPSLWQRIKQFFSWL
ncbi:carboxypeptidase regulatory-like domain-containing protein [Patescibacteria group bacterium]|nr:carboxypeptidase regulatory-like domain-containing protein [Patescibacteria group bacterium]